MRVVFLGSAPFATPVFQRLCASPHRPLALLTRPERPQGRGLGLKRSPLVALAGELGIEVLQPADPHAAACLERLRELGPEVLFVASYGKILRPELLELTPQGALNAHASLLPRHRGASPVQAAILAGDAVTGVSIQRLVAELDAGDVLLVRQRPIGRGETAGELAAALAELAGEAAVEALDLLEAGQARFVPQDPAGVTRTRKLRKDSGRIDWTRDAASLERFVRAMTPWPGARFRDPAGREVTLLRAREFDSTEVSGARPGELVAAGGRFVAGSARGLLELEEVAPAGKRAMSGAEFLRGARLAPGSQLPSFIEGSAGSSGKA